MPQNPYHIEKHVAEFTTYCGKFRHMDTTANDDHLRHFFNIR